MQALLSDGPLEGNHRSRHGCRGKAAHTIDVVVNDGHICFYDLKDVAAGARHGRYVFRDQQTL
jgi:hypothetical protein